MFIIIGLAMVGAAGILLFRSMPDKNGKKPRYVQYGAVASTIAIVVTALVATGGCLTVYGVVQLFG